MNGNRNIGIVGALGIAAGGLLIAALGQLADPPSARADTPDFTNVIDALDFSATAGQNALIDASTALFGGNVPGALADSFVAWDDYSLASQYDVLINTYADLTGATGDFEVDLSFGSLPIPTTLSETAAEVAPYVDLAQMSLTEASGEFAAANVTGALTSLSIASEDLTQGVQVGLLGLTDVLLGLTPVE